MTLKLYSNLGNSFKY